VSRIQLEATMKDLSLRQLGFGISCVKSNAGNLLEEARILKNEKRTARAYALAYTACEELGKIPILVGAAARLSSNQRVDWRSFSRRFRSHESKAIQFNALDAALQVLLKAKAEGKKAIDLKALKVISLYGALKKRASLKERNAALYCDFQQERFVSPDEIITTEILDVLMEVAERQLKVADELFVPDVEAVIKLIGSEIDPDRFNDLTHMRETLDLVFGSASNSSTDVSPK
jgi:AbiV family abortive infection protein